jgi:hypothetical protein
MTIAAMLVNRASRAGSCFDLLDESSTFAAPRGQKKERIAMPRGRSTFMKRQKEQARQQKQREKAERRNQRKQEKPEGSSDEMRELREHAEAQAALFRIDPGESKPTGSSVPQSSKGWDQ